MTADNNSTEDKPDPTPFKVYPMTTKRAASACGAGPPGNLPPRSRLSNLQVAKSAGTTRFISAAGKFGPSDRLLMSCVQKPTTALMRRSSTAKPPSPDPLAPISGKDNHDHGTMAKVGRDEWL